METTLYITKNTQTGKNELITEHLFCRDIWKEIKSFLFYPIDIARGLRNVSQFLELNSRFREDEYPTLFVSEEIRKALREEAWRVPRGTKTLSKVLEKTGGYKHPFDLATGECLLEGLNVELYRYWERRAQRTQKEFYRNEFGRRKNRLTKSLAPFHSPKGDWCSYSGQKIVSQRELECYYFGRRAMTRQEAIITIEKESRLQYISVAMYKAFLFKKKISLAGMTIKEFLGRLMRHSSLDKGTLFAIGGIPLSWKFIDTL